jgi:hypothetical protein
MSVTAAAYAKARVEIIDLFGWDADSLAPAQTLRVDCATALRLGLDALQGALIRGESVDTAKMLTASEALSRLLPPAVLASPPAERREDPREALFNLIMQQRARDGIPDEGTTQATINAQAAEIAQLRAQLAGKAPEDSDVPTVVGRVPAPAPTGNVVSLPRVPAPAAPAADMVDLRAGFNDTREPWREFATDVDGVPLSVRGK